MILHKILELELSACIILILTLSTSEHVLIVHTGISLFALSA